MQRAEKEYYGNKIYELKEISDYLSKNKDYAISNKIYKIYTSLQILLELLNSLLLERKYHFHCENYIQDFEKQTENTDLD